MKKFILITLVGLFVFGFTFAQTTQVDVNVLNKVIELLQNLIKTSTPSPVDTFPSLPSVSSPSKPCKPRPACLDATPPCMIPEPEEGWCPASGSSLIPSPVETKIVPLPKGVSPAVPLEKPITPEVIRPILPDENREDDVIVQLNNLRITRIVTSTPFLTSDTRAIFFAVRDMDWRCFIFESEDAPTGMPCLMDLRRPIALKELAIKITNDTILLQRNRQRAKLEDFQVNDKINVYGFMDKNNYGVEGLIVRKLGTKIVPLPMPKPVPSPIMPLPRPTTSLPERPICIQVITPAYNPQNPSECKEFPTPCDVPPGWVKADKCPVKSFEGTTITPTSSTAHKEAVVEADDYGFYPASLEVTKGVTVSLTFKVRESGVYYGGLDFRSEKFKTEVVKPGSSTKVVFVADKDFTISSYWPLSNVKKAEMKVLAK